MSSTALLWTGAPAAAIALILLVFAWVRRRHGLALIGTVLGAAGAFVLVSGWLLAADPRAGLAETLKTSGLAAGSIVALYALWLNDRRRRVEEERQRLETRRTEHDRERVADERFAKAVELLGHEADQVRVGALHALAAIARSRPDYTQTVLDVLCAYLRRPFDHPDFVRARSAEPEVTRGYTSTGEPSAYLVDKLDGWEREQIVAATQEREVRRTAQGLIPQLLPRAGSDGPAYDLNLTRAWLDRLRFGGRRLGLVLAQDSVLLRVTDLSGAELCGHFYLTRATFYGPLLCKNATFHGKAGFGSVSFHGDVDFSGSTFTTKPSFKDTKYLGGRHQQLKLPES